MNNVLKNLTVYAVYLTVFTILCTITLQGFIDDLQVKHYVAIFSLSSIFTFLGTMLSNIITRIEKLK
jgi:hypothetical protein